MELRTDDEVRGWWSVYTRALDVHTADRAVEEFRKRMPGAGVEKAEGVTTGFYERNEPWLDGHHNKLVLFDLSPRPKGCLRMLALDCPDDPRWSI